MLNLFKTKKPKTILTKHSSNEFNLYTDLNSKNFKIVFKCYMNLIKKSIPKIIEKKIKKIILSNGSSLFVFINNNKIYGVLNYIYPGFISFASLTIKIKKDIIEKILKKYNLDYEYEISKNNTSLYNLFSLTTYNNILINTSLSKKNKFNILKTQYYIQEELLNIENNIIKYYADIIAKSFYLKNFKIKKIEEILLKFLQFHDFYNCFFFNNKGEIVSVLCKDEPNTLLILKTTLKEDLIKKISKKHNVIIKAQ